MTTYSGLCTCYSCYMASNFQYYGMTEGYSEKKLTDDYAKWLEEAQKEEGIVIVECIDCGEKVRYLRKWIAEESL